MGARSEKLEKKLTEYCHQLLKDRVEAANGAKVAEELGVYPSTVTRWLSGDREPSLAKALEIITRYGDAQEIFGANLLFKPIQPIVKLFGQVESAIPPEHVPIEDYYAAPLVSGRIAAGPGAIVEEEIKSLVWIYAPELRARRRHNLVAVQLDKDATSMQPTLFPGDIVLIDRDEPQGKDDFKSGKIYAVRLRRGEDDCAVKRVYRVNEGLVISSDNREYAPEAAFSDDIRELIVGRVVWGWRNLLEV